MWIKDVAGVSASIKYVRIRDEKEGNGSIWNVDNSTNGKMNFGEIEDVNWI